jgi:ribosome biogenesis protein ENP2
MTCINFSNDGLLMALGNVNGKASVYDLRNPKPLYTINHSYKLPIKKIQFHESSQNIITVDKKLAKFSNMKTGKAFTNLETKHDINDFESIKNSGMFTVSLFIYIVRDGKPKNGYLLHTRNRPSA